VKYHKQNKNVNNIWTTSFGSKSS